MGGRGSNGSRALYSNDEYAEEEANDAIRDDYEKTSWGPEVRTQVPQKTLDGFNNSIDKAKNVKQLNAIEDRVKKAYKETGDLRLKEVLSRIDDEKRTFR